MNHLSKDSGRLALFDVCQTLVSVTTITNFTEEFLLNREENPRASRVRACLHQIYKYGRRLGLVSSPKYTRYLASLFKGYTEVEIEAIAQRYAEHLWIHIVDPVYQQLLAHKAAGDHVYLLTAGLDGYLRPFAERLGVGLICSRLSKDQDGNYTGSLEGSYCTGEQKWIEVQRQVLATNEFNLTESAAYGDSYSDLFVLSEVGRPVAVNPDARLRAHAMERSWEVMNVGKSRESIAFLINDLKRAGAQRVFVDDANRLRLLGYDTITIALMQRGALEKELDGALISIAAESPLDISALWRLRKTLQKHKVTLLISTLNEANLAARLTAITLPKLKLVTREANTADKKTVLYKLFDIALSWRSSRILGVSSAVAQSLAHYMPWVRGKIAVLYNGTDIYDIAHEGARSGLLCVASLTRKKDIQVLIRAMALLDMSLTLIGDGSEREPLRALADDLGVADRITFIGEAGREAISAAYESHALFVLPSLHEGCPNVVLEAKAHGLPVVAFAIPGMDEFVSDESGYLVTERTPEALARGIMETYGTRVQKAVAALAEVKRMSKEIHTEKLLSLLEL